MRERGSALVIVMVVLVTATVFGGLLVAIPNAGYDRIVQSEEKEASLYAAQAGLQEAIISLNNGTIDASTLPYDTTASPRTFGKGSNANYSYKVESLSGTSYLKITATGSHSARKVSIQAGAVTGKTIKSVVEAIVYKNPPTTSPFPGAFTIFPKSGKTGTGTWEAKVNGAPGTITGNDATSPAPATGTAVPTLGIAFDTNLTNSPNTTLTITGGGSGPSNIQGTAGDGANYGGVTPAPSADTVNTTAAQTFFSNLDAAVTGGRATITTSNGSSTVNVTGGSLSNPQFVVVRLTGSPSADPVVSMSAGFVGIILIDYKTNNITANNKKDMFQTNGSEQMTGIIAVDLPDSFTWTTDTNSGAVYKKNGSGAVVGGIVMRTGNITGTPKLVHANGTGSLQYSSGAIASVQQALSSTGYKLISSRIVS
jgi:hypothetical protein